MVVQRLYINPALPYIFCLTVLNGSKTVVSFLDKDKDMPHKAAQSNDLPLSQRLLPWQIKRILIMSLQCPPTPRFAAFCALAETSIFAEKPEELGKSRHIAPLNGSQMVVEIWGSYYQFHLPS